MRKNSRIGPDILVVGVRRGGTTFTGRMLSLPGEVGFVFEPFNYEQGVRGISEGWYPYMTAGEVGKKRERLLDALFDLKKLEFKVSLGDGKTDHFSYDSGRAELVENVFTNYSREGLLRRVGRAIVKNKSNLSYLKARLNPFVKRLLVKDPIASLSSRYLAERYELQVVVLTRHPAAVYHSMKKLGWGMDPKYFLEQEKLIEDYLGKYVDDLRNASEREEYALLEWLVVNRVLFDFAENNENFYLVRHEDICLNPEAEFAGLYEKFGLKFTAEVRNKIREQTSGEKAEGEDVSDIKRDSRELAYSWKSKLSDNEVATVKERTFQLAKQYYPEEEW